LLASITKFDLVEIPAVNTDGTIIAGHQRLRLLLELGREREMIDVRVPRRVGP
jgi:site-specific DNA-methyltransferase (adenine-specific)